MRANKAVAIIQARMGSNRLPGKTLMSLVPQSVSLLAIVISRLKLTKYIDEIIVATTDLDEDKVVVEEARRCNVKAFVGSSEDVLLRYSDCSDLYPSDFIVRVTADDPFKDPNEIDALVDKAKRENFDYLANNYLREIPEGMDVEVLSKRALQKSNVLASSPLEREHITQWLRTNGPSFGLKIGGWSTLESWPDARLTIDTDADLALAREIFSLLKNDILHDSELLKLLLQERVDLVNRSLRILPKYSGLNKQ